MRGSKRPAETLISEPEMEDAEKNVNERNGFFACYLLCSLCPRYKGHTYIGFTVNPRRRIRQHNGEIKCGAWRTKSKRPWEMVLCIHGFPSKVSALQFEWAWQHPRESKAVREAALSFKSLSGLVNKIKLAHAMLTLPQWGRFNLSVNFFSSQYTTHSAHCPRLPKHMKTTVLPMTELPCYSNNSILDDDDEDDDRVLQEQEIHDTHEPISPIHPQILESGEVEPTWMKSHDNSYQEEQDHDHDLRRRNYPVHEHNSQIHHEEEPSWMKVYDFGEEPSWIEVHDDRYELDNDHRDHDLQEIYVNGDISLSHTKNSELEGEPAWFKVRDDDDHVHDFLGEKDHDGPTNVASNKETPSTEIDDSRSKLYHNHDIHECTSLNHPEYIESDEENEHTPVHGIQSSVSLMHQSQEVEEKEEDDIHESISLCALKTLQSEGVALTKRFNSGEPSMTTHPRGASLLDVIDLSTPLCWKVVCKRRKSMASICMEVVDLTGSPA